MGFGAHTVEGRKIVKMVFNISRVAVHTNCLLNTGTSDISRFLTTVQGLGSPRNSCSVMVNVTEKCKCTSRSIINLFFSFPVFSHWMFSSAMFIGLLLIGTRTGLKRPQSDPDSD